MALDARRFRRGIQLLTYVMRPLRVCHIASGDLWAGAEVQIAALLKDLKRFSDVEVSAVVLNKGRLYGELTSSGIRVTLYDERYLNSLKILQGLIRDLRIQTPHIIHTHRYKENVLSSIASKVIGGVALVQTVHGLQERLTGWGWSKIALYAGINGIATRYATQGMIGVSKEIVYVLKQRYPTLTIAHISNGIDVSSVHASVAAEVKRKELGIPDNAVVVGTVCRLTPIKGIEYLIKAVKHLQQNGALGQLRLVLVGDGPSRPLLEELTAELGLKHEVLFLGTRDDVYDLINVFDVYALPSLHEGIPMALLEAMTLGRPVVASRVGGIPEVITDQVNGRLVPAENPIALAETIKELAVSADQRLALGERAKNYAHEHHDLKRMSSMTRAFYRHVVGQV
jgi:L-malate glycosyltransferase